MVDFMGPPLLGSDEHDPGGSRVATVFLRAGVIVTVPGIHATQRLAYAQQVDQQRKQQGLPALTADQRMDLFQTAVDLLVKGELVLIRPDPSRMDLALEADELLQTLVPREQIKFLLARYAEVRDALYRRGEAWRIQPLPRSLEEMRQLIAASRIAVTGRPIYRYNTVYGTRILTCAEYAAMASWPDEELRGHLVEINQLAGRINARGWPDLELFATGDALDASGLKIPDAQTLPIDQLRLRHQELAERFTAAVPLHLQHDDLDVGAWRNRMYSVLIDRRDDVFSDEDLLGMSEEYFMQIQWLPGARVEGEDLVIDPATLDHDDGGEIAHGLICNLMREHMDMQYINVGRVVRPLGSPRRAQTGGRRDVYVAQFQLRGEPRPRMQMIRFLKWGVAERLDEGKDLARAMIECEEYTDWTMDRRLACRQLGMHLATTISMGKIQERYRGTQTALTGITIWSPYGQRDYISGVATEKIPAIRLRDAALAQRLARLLGQAAAPNLIAGRASLHGDIVFDDGDEILVNGDDDQRADIVISDPTGAFMNYQTDLAVDIVAYAQPILRRWQLLADPAAFADRYITAFVERLTQMQATYRQRRRVFDYLFRHRRRDPAGNLAHRWEVVLYRLDRADPVKLGQIIRDTIAARRQ